MKASLICLHLMSLVLPLSAGPADVRPREVLLFNADWRFQKGDPEGTGDNLSYSHLKPWLLPTANSFITTPSAVRPEGDAPGEKTSYAQAAFDDAKWRKLDLPHDWAIEGPFNQDLPGETGKLPWAGIAWYRKTFDLPAEDEGRRAYLEIDGAMSNSAVWCNGKFVGGWPYGYSSYRLDLTDFLKPGAKNTLAIRLDNPLESSRWYPGGGIYRDVRLVKTSPAHIAPATTYITTPEVSPDSATVDLKASLINRSAAPAAVSVSTRIFKLSDSGNLQGGAVAASEPVVLALEPGASTPYGIQLKVPKPALWDTARPERYTAVTVIQQDGKVADRLETPFGIRTIAFTANDGFHLNGKRVPLRGVCLHHDLGALGSAFNLRAAERQLQIMKEMGCNAIRITHNPQAPAFLDLCDRMGFLVISEFTDTWTNAKTSHGYARLFNDWSEADWRSLIRRDRNHPSVILWSSGNEVAEQGKPEEHPISTRLTEIAKEEDPTRLSTVGCDRPAAGFNGFQKTVGVFGFNYKPMLYQKFHTESPDIPFYGSETSSTVSTRGEYVFPVENDKKGGKVGFQMSSYDLYAPPWAFPPDTEFKGQDENPSSSGEFVWTGFDYLGEPTPFNDDVTILTNFHTPEEKAKAEEEIKALGKLRIPSRSSYFGIVDLAGFKKDRFYIYQARWRPDMPMAHILPHWNWPERVGQVTPVHVYTSGDEAELFLNGQSLGRKKRGPLEYRFRWDDVVYAPGELKVVTYQRGKAWATETINTTGEATQLIAKADRNAITADGQDLSFITVSVADKDGRMVPRSKQGLKFELSGPGEIAATDNGDPTDHTSFQSPTRSAFNGLALVVVRAKPQGDGGPITLRVTAEGLAPAEVKIETGRP